MIISRIIHCPGFLSRIIQTVIYYQIISSLITALFASLNRVFYINKFKQIESSRGAI